MANPDSSNVQEAIDAVEGTDDVALGENTLFNKGGKLYHYEEDGTTLKEFSISANVRREIEGAYGSGWESLFNKELAIRRLFWSEISDQERARIRNIAQRTCGALTDPKLLMRKISPEKNAINAILKDDISSNPDELSPNIKAAFRRLPSDPTELADFLKGMGVVDSKKIKDLTVKIQKNKAVLKESEGSASYFSKNPFGPILGTFKTLKKTKKILGKESLFIALNKLKAKKSFIFGGKNQLSHIETLDPTGFLTKLNELRKNLEVFVDLGVTLPKPPTGNYDLVAMIKSLSTLSKSNFSVKDLEDVFEGTELFEMLENEDPKDVNKIILGESSKKQDELEEDEAKLESMRTKAKTEKNLSDEEFALKVIGRHLTTLPETHDMSPAKLKKYAKHILFGDILAMENDDYLKNNLLSPKPLEKALTEKILKINFKVGAEEEIQRPLAKVRMEDLKDEKSVRDAIGSGRIDWQAAFVLFLSLEKNGQKGSETWNTLYKEARVLMAQEMGLEPTDADVASKFDDQVNLLNSTVIDNYFDTYDNNEKEIKKDMGNFVKRANKWMREGLRSGDLDKDDFPSVLQELEEAGYFDDRAALLKEERASLGFLSYPRKWNLMKQEVPTKAQLIARLEGMFNVTGGRQKRLDKSRVIGKELGKMGASAIIPTAGVALKAALAYLKLGFKTIHYPSKLLHLPYNMLKPKNWLHPIQGILEGSGAVKKSFVEGIQKDIAKAVEGTKAFATGTFERGKRAGLRVIEGGKAMKANMKENTYGKRNNINAEKLKSAMEPFKIRKNKSKLTLLNSPFIDLSKYKSETKAA
jgi:hypothetical protein